MKSHGRILNDFREPEIADLKHAVVNENISRFKITMYGLFLGQLLVPFDDLFHDIESFFFRQFLFDLKILLEVAISAVLHDNVKTAF